MTSLSSPPSAVQSPPGVLQQLVRLRQPEGALPSAQSVVEDDRRDLPALAASGAVAQHPAPAEAHRLRKRLPLGSDEGGVDLVGVVLFILATAVDGLPLGADAVLRGEMARMGLARQYDALQLRVRQEAVRDHPLRQHRSPGRHGVRYGRHGGGLHQRRRMLDRARHSHDARPPRRVGAGVAGRRFGFGGNGFDRAGLDREFGDRAPLMGPPRLGGRCGFGTPLRRLRRDRLAEQVAGGSGVDRDRRDRPPLRHLRDNGVEQLGGVRGMGSAVQFDGGSDAALQHGEAGVEPGAPARIGAAVDRHGEDAARRRVETADGIAQDAMGRGDGHQPAARRQHRGGRADMAQVGVVPGAVDTGRCRERRVHQHHGRTDVVKPVGDGLGVERRHHGLGEQPGQQPRPGLRIFVEMEIAGGGVAQRALRHHRQHAGAGRGLQHDIARPDRGGLQRGIGERQRSRELLKPDLLFRPPGVRGLQRGDRLQHGQHAARPVRTGTRIAAHAPAVALHEEHYRRLGGLVGVLPDPAALGIGRAERLCHGVPEGRGIERPAGLQHGQQGLGSGEQGVARGRTGRRSGRVYGGGGKGRTREGVRRRAGVEHGPVSVLKGVGPAWAGR